MTETVQPVSQQETYAWLYGRAMERWGKARAEAIRPNLERLAQALAQLEHNAPTLMEDPAFFW